jgi:hypothetical protein
MIGGFQQLRIEDYLYGFHCGLLSTVYSLAELEAQPRALETGAE